jgi:HEAT repeat protein
VPSLSALLGGNEASLRQEAAKALARIGDVAAIDALIAALGSTLPDVPNLAVFSLGATGNPRAVPALLHALRESISAGNIDFAREAIRALGRLGRAEATRDLADLLLRRSLLSRRRFRELKLAAASALGQIPGDEAVGALAQAAQSRDPQLRRAAQTALERRAHLLASS